MLSNLTHLPIDSKIPTKNNFYLIPKPATQLINLIQNPTEISDKYENNYFLFDASSNKNLLTSNETKTEKIFFSENLSENCNSCLDCTQKISNAEIGTKINLSQNINFERKNNIIFEGVDKSIHSLNETPSFFKVENNTITFLKDTKIYFVDKEKDYFELIEEEEDEFIIKTNKKVFFELMMI